MEEINVSHTNVTSRAETVEISKMEMLTVTIFPFNRGDANERLAFRPNR